MIKQLDINALLGIFGPRDVHLLWVFPFLRSAKWASLKHRHLRGAVGWDETFQDVRPSSEKFSTFQHDLHLPFKRILWLRRQVKCKKGLFTDRFTSCSFSLCAARTLEGTGGGHILITSSVHGVHPWGFLWFSTEEISEATLVEGKYSFLIILGIEQKIRSETAQDAQNLVDHQIWQLWQNDVHWFDVSLAFLGKPTNRVTRVNRISFFLFAFGLFWTFGLQLARMASLFAGHEENFVVIAILCPITRVVAGRVCKKYHRLLKNILFIQTKRKIKKGLAG